MKVSSFNQAVTGNRPESLPQIYWKRVLDATNFEVGPKLTSYRKVR